jgi:hypothetical protein
MLRTLQTTVGLFRDHPQKHLIRFILIPTIKECLYLNNDLMAGPFRKQIFDIYSDPSREETGGLKFEFDWVMGMSGAESMM